jgi:HEPN domain-containing protein
MPEYSLDFSEKLIEAARVVLDLDNNSDSVDAKRTVLYLSLLACEISMKALLERAGKSVSEIRSRSHNLEGLLEDLGSCEVEENIANGVLKWVSGNRLRAKEIITDTGNSTIGILLTGSCSFFFETPNT